MINNKPPPIKPVPSAFTFAAVPPMIAISPMIRVMINTFFWYASRAVS